MRSRKDIHGYLDAFLREIAPEVTFKAGEDPDRTAARPALIAASVMEVRKLELEVMLDIRDAITTWIAGDLSARSTAQQYRNTAVDVIVKLLQGIDKKLERLEVRGRP